MTETRKRKAKPMTHTQVSALGGKATAKKHGKKHFIKMAKARWAKKGK